MPLRSMTGFGVAQVTTRDGGVLVVEARSVNARFREVKLRQPFGAAVESRLRAAVEHACGRGRVEVAVAWRPATAAAASAAGADAGLAGAAEHDLRGLGVDAGTLQTVARAAVAAAAISAEEGLEVKTPNVLELLRFAMQVARDDSRADPAEEPSFLDAEPAPAELDEVLARGLAALVRFRDDEGEALASELGALIDALAAQRLAIAGALGDDEQRRTARLRGRALELAAALDVGTLDADRLRQDLALLLLKGDVAEELARIDSHLAQARGVLAEPAAPGQGKRLEFLAQELHREVSTLGAKIVSHEGSARVIEAKALVERIREQVCNVE